MNTRIISAISLIFLVACSSKKPEPEIAGAYKMVSQRFKNEKRDTTYTAMYQMKIYTGGYMMYAHINPANAISSFGVATYVTKGDSVIEHMIFESSDSTLVIKPPIYRLGVEKTPKGYKQIINDLGSEHYVLTEEYESAGSDIKSPLDGLWKMRKAYYTDGKDTVLDVKTQYKIYCAGNVIWGCTYDKGQNKVFTAMGYGEFEMKGDNNEVKEDVKRSTYVGVTGRDFYMDIDMNGSDEFTQTYTFTSGHKMVEIYERVKK